MPNPDSFKISNRELLALIIRAAGVKTGKWQLSVNMTFSAINFGPDADGVIPGALVGFESMGITLAVPGAPPSLCMDAESVWEQADENDKP